MLEGGHFGHEQATEVGESTRARGLHGEMTVVVMAMIVAVVMIVAVMIVVVMIVVVTVMIAVVWGAKMDHVQHQNQGGYFWARSGDLNEWGT